MPLNHFENLGFGVGLRTVHYPYIFEHSPKVDFFEIISENFMVDGGPPLYNLDKILEQYRVVQHGVSMSIASAEPLNFDYLKKLKKLTQITKTPWFSDHLCWSQNNSHCFHDLLPIPYTEENAKYIAQKARIVQDYIELPFALENLSTYISFKDSQMSEWEFYRMVVEEAGCYMMLDVNNVYVSAINHHFDPYEYLKSLPYERVVQVHLAGHSTLDDGTRLDTHDHYVCDEVWKMYQEVSQKTRGISTLLEWDDKFLPFPETLAEVDKARKIAWQTPELTNPPKSLKTHQNSFGSSIATPFILHPEGYELQSKLYSPELVNRVKATKEKEPVERISTYNEQYWFRLITTMQTEFPLLEHLIGLNDFNQLAIDYIDQYPSENPNLNHLADRFKKFLQETQPWSELEMLHQCVELEQIYIRLFDVAEQKFNFDKEQVDENKVDTQITLQDSLFLFQEDWNLLRMKQFLKEGKDISDVPAELKSYWVLSRQENRFITEELTYPQFLLLSKIKNGADLNQACLELEQEISSEELNEVEANISTWFSLWTSYGWFQSLK